MSAEERRESVIRAAMTEFGRGGYHGTSTEAIARRVGVSQPYLFRLFPSKQAIFLAAVGRCMRETREVFRLAVEKEPETDPGKAMARAYQELIRNRDILLMQMQAYVTVASAEVEGDQEFGAAVRAEFEELWDAAHLRLGDDTRETTGFMAHGMLINALVALGFPAEHRVWSGFGFGRLPDREPEAPEAGEPREG